MYRISKTVTFDAAHRLSEHDGRCSRLHGHTYTATIVIEAAQPKPTGPKRGMVADFGQVSDVVEAIVDRYLDHRYLNDTVDVYPTSENLAKWLFGKLKPDVPNLAEVTISESCTTQATYRERGGLC